MFTYGYDKARQWANNFLSDSSSQRENLDQFLIEVNNENAENLTIDKPFDNLEDFRPSFAQISDNSIEKEANKNIQLLKSMETILQERTQAYERFLAAYNKTGSCFESLQESDGTLRQGFDAFFVFINTEIQRASQQLDLNKCRKKLTEIKVGCQKRLSDYQREISACDKEVSVNEKKTFKIRESLDKLREQRARLQGRLASGKDVEEGEEEDYVTVTASATKQIMKLGKLPCLSSLSYPFLIIVVIKRMTALIKGSLLPLSNRMLSSISLPLPPFTNNICTLDRHSSHTGTAKRN